MAYVGFDLDETLGRFSVSEYPTYFLYPHKALYESQWSGRYGRQGYSPPIPLSARLEQKLDTALYQFAECLVEKEKTERLGLLRPGIEIIARHLYELQQEGKVKAVLIYSNNGNLAQLMLAAKMIEIWANAAGLFCTFIHWFHPIRQETGEIMLGNPGAATKTMKTLYKAFSACSDQPIPYTEFVDNLYFFDDVYHRDIAFRIGDRYFQNPPYRYDADPSVVQSCFKTAFFKAGLHEDPDYFEYIAPIFGSKPKTFETINEIVLHDYSQFRRKKNLPNNTTFRRKFNLTFPPTRRINHSLFKTALQRIRSLERKQNSGSQLSPNEETTLENAGKTVTTYELQQQGGKSKRYRRTRKNSKN